MRRSALLVGKAGGRLQGNRHIESKDDEPTSNLLVGMADLMAELRRDDAATPVKEWTVAASDVMDAVKCKGDLENVRANIDQIDEQLHIPQERKGAMRQQILNNVEFSCLLRR